MLSLLVAPLGAAMAGTHMAVANDGPATVHDAAGHAEPSDAHPPETAAAMDDCHKPPSAHHDCPFCDKGDGCEPGWCLAKCFKVFGALAEPVLIWPRLVAADDTASEPARADWRSPPRSPPPRT